MDKHISRDAFLTEMMGECWHTITEHCLGSDCSKCGKEARGFNYLRNPNFSTPANAYRLMQFVMAAEWWGEFIVFADKLWWKEFPKEVGLGLRFAPFSKWLFSDPDRFASLVAEYRGWKEDKG
jgi:hypothetical protein